MSNKPILVIDERTYREYIAIAKKTHLEIAWLSHATIDAQNMVFTLDSRIFMCDQVATGTTVTLSIEGQLDALDRAMEQGLDVLNVWTHSHNTMAVFQSKQDKDQLKENLGNGQYAISIIVNHRGDLKAWLAYNTFNSMRLNRDGLQIPTYNEVEMDIYRDTNAIVKSWLDTQDFSDWDAQINHYLSKPVYTFPPSTNVPQKNKTKNYPQTEFKDPNPKSILLDNDGTLDGEDFMARYLDRNDPTDELSIDA